MSDSDPHNDIDGLLTSVGRTLREIGFDEESMHLTARQAEVLVMREHGLDQATIASHLDCSRANVSNIEASARANLESARETVRFAELLSAPVRVEIPTGIDLYEVPDLIYERCDDHNVKVRHGAPDLIRQIRDTTPTAVRDGNIVDDIAVHVASDGSLTVLTSQGR